MGIITAEVTYPYNTADNTISDLGGSLPPDSVIKQPAATIFDSTMILSGLMVMLGTYLLKPKIEDRLLICLLSLVGMGLVGVGIFNGSYGDIHAIFAPLTFASGGLAAIVSYRVEASPIKYASLVLGIISLGTLAVYFALGESSLVADIGIGGIERLVAYPIVFWLTGFGAYLMGTTVGDESSDEGAAT